MPRGIRCVWCDLAGRSSSGMDGTTGVSGGAHRSLSPRSKGRGKNTFYESMVVSTCRTARRFCDGHVDVHFLMLLVWQMGQVGLAL